MRYNSRECASNRHRRCNGTRGRDEDERPLYCECACHRQLSDEELEQRARAGNEQFTDARKLLEELQRRSHATTELREQSDELGAYEPREQS